MTGKDIIAHTYVRNYSFYISNFVVSVHEIGSKSGLLSTDHEGISEDEQPSLTLSHTHPPNR